MGNNPGESEDAGIGGSASDRRGFLGKLSAMIAAVEVGFVTVGVGSVGPWEDPLSPGGPGGRPQRAADPGQELLPSLPPDAVIGIQMSPHTLLDEGI